MVPACSRYSIEDEKPNIMKFAKQELLFMSPTKCRTFGEGAFPHAGSPLTNFLPSAINLYLPNQKNQNSVSVISIVTIMLMYVRKK